MYGANDSQVPEFSIYLQSETQVQRAGSEWDRYLTAHKDAFANSYKCTADGKLNRGLLIFIALVVAAIAAGVAYAALEAVLYVYRKCTGKPRDDSEEWWMVAFDHGLMVFDEYGDWRLLSELAAAGSAYMLVPQGLLLWSAMLVVTLVLVVRPGALLYYKIRNSAGQPAGTDPGSQAFKTYPPEAQISNSRRWYPSWVPTTLLVLLVYSSLALAAGLIVIVVYFRDLDAFSTCIKNSAAICKPQTRKMFNIMLGGAMPVVVAMHLWPLVTLAMRRAQGGTLKEAVNDNDWVASHWWCKVLQPVLESLPQFIIQAYMWATGYVYITPETWLISFIGSLFSIFRKLTALAFWLHGKFKGADTHPLPQQQQYIQQQQPQQQPQYNYQQPQPHYYQQQQAQYQQYPPQQQRW